MLKKKLGLIAGLLSALCAVTAHAEGLGYTYLDVDYFHVSPDSSSFAADNHGYELVGSYALPANFVLTGSFARSHYPVSKFSGGGPDYTENDRQLGLGYRISLSDRVDLVPEIDYLSKQIDSAGFGFSGFGFTNFVGSTGKGYDLKLTPRFRVTDSLELNAEVDHFYVRYESELPGPFTFVSYGNGNGVSVGMVYSFTPSFAVGADYGNTTSKGLTSKSYDVFGRFYF